VKGFGVNQVVIARNGFNTTGNDDQEQDTGYVLFHQ
jgi:hypothetical protein